MERRKQLSRLCWQERLGGRLAASFQLLELWAEGKAVTLSQNMLGVKANWLKAQNTRLLLDFTSTVSEVPLRLLAWHVNLCHQGHFYWLSRYVCKYILSDYTRPAFTHIHTCTHSSHSQKQQKQLYGSIRMCINLIFSFGLVNPYFPGNQQQSWHWQAGSMLDTITTPYSQRPLFFLINCLSAPSSTFTGVFFIAREL